MSPRRGVQARQPGDWKRFGEPVHQQFADIQVVGRVDSGMDAVDHSGNVTATFSLPVNT